MFQSHNGAIAAGGSQAGFRWLSPCFNPTMVRLLPRTTLIEARCLKSFNPTMVRLLQAGSRELTFRGLVVSIPQWCDCCQSGFKSAGIIFDGFNPTMVRLLPVPCPLSRVLSQSFNPTMVRLLPNSVSHSSCCLCCFNPTMVRLLRLGGYGTHRIGDVSIPQWCDCCAV